MSNEKEIEYLLQTHNSVRNEIAQRIGQRDTFSIQFIVSVGAVFSLGFLDFQFSPFLFLLLPLVTLFYSIQILYSYVIHDRCHAFLVEEIEPRLSTLLNYTPYEKNRLMWESYCHIESKERATKTPGIRKNFFIYTSYIMPFISCTLFGFLCVYKSIFSIHVASISAIAFFVICELINVIILHKFNGKYRKNKLDKLGKVDYVDTKVLKQSDKKKAVFLDRDGTLHIDKVNTFKVEDLQFFKDTIPALKLMQDAGFILIVISNQDGIRKGLYTSKEMHEFNMHMMLELGKEGIHISGIYYSPYQRSDDHYSFKPNPGMLIRAKREFNIDMKQSYFIGDQITDAIAAYNAKVTPLIVKTGIYKNGFGREVAFKEINPQIFDSLLDCCHYIVSEAEK